MTAIQNMLLNEVSSTNEFYNEIWDHNPGITFESQWCGGTVHVLFFLSGRWAGFVHLSEHPNNDEMYMAWSDRTTGCQDIMFTSRASLDEFLFNVALDIPTFDEEWVLSHSLRRGVGDE